MMFSLFGNSSNFTEDDAARLRRLERKLDLILQHLGVAYEADDCGLSDEAKQLAQRGEKIAAIKAYREATGVGLAEAKTVVERYMSQL